MELRTLSVLSRMLALMSISITASADLPTIPGSITTLHSTSQQVYEPHAFSRSRYSGDGANAFLLICSSAIVKLAGNGVWLADESYTVTPLAGHMVITGYEDSVGLMARFSHISDFTQSRDGRKVYISDQNNHCIREYDRVWNNVTVFAGNCTHLGQHTGPRLAARFSSPAGITMSSSWNHIYIADRQNNRILRIDLQSEENWVQTVVDDTLDNRQRVMLPVAIKMSSNGENLYVTTEEGLFRFTNFSTGHNPVKSLVTQVATSRLLDFVLTHNDQSLVAADYDGSRLLFIDLVNGGVGQICTGYRGSISRPRDGSSSMCRLNTPQGLAVIDDTHMFVTEYQSEFIRVVTYQKQDLTTTTTLSPPTTTRTAQSTKTTNHRKPPKTARPRTTTTTTIQPEALAVDSSSPPKSKKKEFNPLVVGLSAGLIIPAVLIGILVGFVTYVQRKTLREAVLMWQRRNEQGGYSGPGIEDSQFQSSLQRNAAAADPPNHNSYRHQPTDRGSYYAAPNLPQYTTT